MNHKAESIVKEHYDLGVLVHLEQMHTGFCNTSFAFHTQKNDRGFKYLVRRYNPATSENEIQFEHALISHLKKNGFAKAAGVVPTKFGCTYAKAGHAAIEYWAVFEFLEGEDRYAWTDTHLTPEEMSSAAEVLADLHRAGQNFDPPPGAKRAQPVIMNFLPTFGAVYGRFLKSPGNTGFGQCFVKHHDDIVKIAQQTCITEPDFGSMQQVPIHCDYHPGNLKFEGLRVIGVFDFDWSKIDVRLFDLALALVYFCACRDDRTCGLLNPEKFNIFLSAYNNRCSRAADPGPLTKAEKAFLPLMLAAANLFVLHWTIVDFYSYSYSEENAYLDYLNQGLQVMYWIEDQKDYLAGLTISTCG